MGGECIGKRRVSREMVGKSIGKRKGTVGKWEGNV